LFMSRGAQDDAQRLLERVVDTSANIVPDPLDNPWVYVQATSIGDDRLADRARQELTRVGALSFRPDIEAHLLLADAWMARREERLEESIALASEAALRFADLSRKLHAAYALEVAERRRDALDAYRAIGSVYDVQRLEKALTPVNRRGRPMTALTTRELQVARELAQGKSNRAIADALVISERTVETHVAAILGKLGVGSRAEAVARFAKEGETIRA
jgi:DNA-binding CsgD family transcriptional regulator